MLMLVLSASPLVSSAMAASTGQWSGFWGNPQNGTVQTAEEEEVGHDASRLAPAEQAVLWFEVGHTLPVAEMDFAGTATRPAAPSLSAAPTPPPENRA